MLLVTQLHTNIYIKVGQQQHNPQNTTSINKSVNVNLCSSRRRQQQAEQAQQQQQQR
jgi:hypothetical protein